MLLLQKRLRTRSPGSYRTALALAKKMLPLPRQGPDPFDYGYPEADTLPFLAEPPQAIEFPEPSPRVEVPNVPDQPGTSSQDVLRHPDPGALPVLPAQLASPDIQPPQPGPCRPMPTTAMPPLKAIFWLLSLRLCGDAIGMLARAHSVGRNPLKML